MSPTQQLSAPVQELQVDYWPLHRPVEKSQGDKKSSGDQGKNSVKSTFRNLQVSTFYAELFRIFKKNLTIQLLF